MVVRNRVFQAGFELISRNRIGASQLGKAPELHAYFLRICAFSRSGSKLILMGWAQSKRIDLLEAALGGLRRLARRGSSPQKPTHLLTGLDGETAAVFHLRRKGYIVVAQRWASGDVPGDIDLIAWQGETLCFIEVKTRTARDLHPAEIAVDWHKRKILRQLARRYLRQLPHQTPPPVRFDVLSVYLVPGKDKEFLHFEGAFGWGEGPDEDRR